ncbi:MAG: hypothetical protein KME60_22240 [Cyanomargarita calcarea GSE-NOS-MK-12-04C]|jgi:hypothetical protein|uniref:Uncharacterized protein n=1 Tax=Cyanomargarita calcarea GSE-NOS-MK-12-04C TaxID=2839659 RepID=A0A951QPC7_9CYAN|nr:hypothetical protein [Cyanomargarita calcarea GSE-NOS-MK-12-04C]
MHGHSNLKHQQLSLNFKGFEYFLVEGLFTKAVRELIQIIANKQITTKDIHQYAEKGGLQLRYSYGILRIVPSYKGKSGRFWRWDVICSPVSLKSVSSRIS